MKVCSRCRENKPLQAFYTDPRYRLGVMGWCKQCRGQYSAGRKAEIAKLAKPVIATKTCSACKREKSGREFSRMRTAKDGLASRCKDCRRDIEAPHRMTTDAMKRQHLWNLYRMTQDDVEAMLRAQDYKCAICRVALVRVFIDHCHATLKVRGILCCGCNTKLGTLENATFVANAREYLARHAEECDQPGFSARRWVQNGHDYRLKQSRARSSA